MTNKALDQLLAAEKDAREFGFEWPHTEMIVDQAISECEEIREAIAKGESSARVQEEIGDLLHTAISLCEFAGFDTKETLALAAEKFTKRMRVLKMIARDRGLPDFHGQTTDRMLQIWAEAKVMANSD